MTPRSALALLPVALLTALLTPSCKKQPRVRDATRRPGAVASPPAVVIDVRAEHLAVWRAVKQHLTTLPAGSFAAELDIVVAGDTGSGLGPGQAAVRLAVARHLGGRMVTDIERHLLTLARSGPGGGYAISSDEVTDPALPPSAGLSKLAFPRRIARPDRPALTLTGEVVLTVHFSPADDLLQLELRGRTGVRVFDLGDADLGDCIAEPPEPRALVQLGCHHDGRDKVWLHVEAELIRVERNINVCPQCAGLMLRRVPLLRVAVPPGTQIVRAFPS